MQDRIIGAGLAAALLAGCAGAPTELESDAVIAGTRYAGAPVDLGTVRMWLALREGAAPDGSPSGNLRLTLGFLAADDTARVVLSRATLRYGDRAAELVARRQAPGSAQGCGADGGAALAQDYWFNAPVTAASFTCVTLAFVAPGRGAGDALELRMEPINVDGELVRTLPIAFAARAPE